MAVLIELHNTGDPSIGAEVRALVEHALSDRAGDWRVSIVGSRESDSWEMKILGPNGFERSYTLAGGAGERQPSVIANVLMRLLPGKMGRGERESPITYKRG
jgi:hypothetical protein